MPGSRDISDTQASCPDRVLLRVGTLGPISKQQEYRFTGAALRLKRCATRPGPGTTPQAHCDRDVRGSAITGCCGAPDPICFHRVLLRLLGSSAARELIKTCAHMSQISFLDCEAL